MVSVNGGHEGRAAAGAVPRGREARLKGILVEHGMGARGCRERSRGLGYWGNSTPWLEDTSGGRLCTMSMSGGWRSCEASWSRPRPGLVPMMAIVEPAGLALTSTAVLGKEASRRKTRGRGPAVKALRASWSQPQRSPGYRAGCEGGFWAGGLVPRRWGGALGEGGPSG